MFQLAFRKKVGANLRKTSDFRKFVKIFIYIRYLQKKQTGFNNIKLFFLYIIVLDLGLGLGLSNLFRIFIFHL